MSENRIPFRLAPLAAALMMSSFGAAAQSPNNGPQEWAPGRLIVMQRAGLPQAQMSQALAPHGGKARRLGASDLHIVDLPRGMPETVVQRLLNAHPAFKFASLDYKAPKAFQSNDPYAGSQWHLPVTRTPAAWDVATGAGVTIAVLDGGVLANHPDLVANLLPGYNAWDGGSETSDINNHGTAVAGTAAAALNNGIGVSGVAGGARIKPIRITDYSGTAWYSTIASGIIYAADRGFRVVNCSYGWLFKDASVQSAGNYLKSKGGLLVVSAGNNASNENAAATTAMITVSATDSADNLAGWSSYGSMVSVAAPGVGIWTTAANGGYESASGTSFAAPLVAGVVALMMSANPALSPAMIESLLFSTATDLGAAGKDIYFGWGRVNSEAAVAAARSASAADTQKPSVAITGTLAGSTVSGLVAVDVSATDNIGVVKVELRANGAVVASDLAAPFQFSLDSKQFANGSLSLTAVAYDAASNSQTSPAVLLNVANNLVADTSPPQVAFASPAEGAQVSGTVQIGTSATDNAGAAGIRQSLYINGTLRQTSVGAVLSYSWNSRKDNVGAYSILVVARDAAGNSTTRSISVSKVK